VLGIVNSEIVKVTNKNVQKEIDINTEVLGIVNSEIVKVTNKKVQKEIDINTEVLTRVIHYICNIKIKDFLLCQYDIASTESSTATWACACNTQSA
jgi:hypothetical protein